MGVPHIRSVEVAEDGLIVMYDDSTCAFYHESVLQAHLQDAAGGQGKGGRKPVGSVRGGGTARVLRWRKKGE